MIIARRPTNPPPLTRAERREVGAALRDAADALLPAAEDQDRAELWHLLALLTELHDVVCPGGKYSGLPVEERTASRTVHAKLLDSDD